MHIDSDCADAMKYVRGTDPIDQRTWEVWCEPGDASWASRSESPETSPERWVVHRPDGAREPIDMDNLTKAALVDRIDRDRHAPSGRPRDLRSVVRLAARPRTRAFRRPDRDLLVPGQVDRLRQGHRGFAVSYADQNERDYEAMQVAVKQGRIRSEIGL